MDHVHRRNQLRYQGQVRSQLEQTGDLGGSNPYGRCQEDATAKPKRSESSSRVPLWPPGNLDPLFRKGPLRP